LPTASGSGTDPFDILFYIIAVGVAVMLGSFALVGAIEAWRRWSTNRKIKRHLRN
jgi:hypothetical protein